jgi:hypothetical protein
MALVSTGLTAIYVMNASVARHQCYLLIDVR